MVERWKEDAMVVRYKRFRSSVTGSVAVEMALILPLFLILLAGPLYMARAAWFYSVGQKAAHDATRYIATATQAELRTGGGGFNEARVPAIARWIAQQELGELVPLTDSIAIGIQCDGEPCSALTPTQVHTSVQITLHDHLLGSLTMDYLGSADITMTSEVTMRYVAQ
ncbi:MAG: TadE/TadG family type IV pilus assembly protein [Massilia sp.]|uniref:TadE/TadG family type IV pilus assembly protein n=1 Tax=Massilia sp. TaxID=1882437 RepID=UPI001997B4BB|nr:pilus assembly protein [Oxalobacteraceae sp. CFBP 8761]